MPIEQQRLDQPKIIISKDSSPDHSRRIAYIDGRIHENPELFRKALQKVGEVATSQTVEFGGRGESVRELLQEPADLIIEFFRNRYDVDSEYDDATEQVIASDPDHRLLVENMRSKTSDRLQTSVMSSKSRPNQEAIPARDLVRLSRFDHYLGQVTLHNQQQIEQAANTPTQEPKADLQAIG